MDWGCQFFTPPNIASSLARHIDRPEVIVDLFAGSGKLHLPILELHKDSLDVLALDIDANIPLSTHQKVKNIIADCLDPNNVSSHITPHVSKKTTFVLNPPFKALDSSKEIDYWKNISVNRPSKLTHRVGSTPILRTLHRSSRTYPCSVDISNL